MRIFVTRPIPQAGMDVLYDFLPSDKIAVHPLDRAISREALLEGVRGAFGLLCHLTDKIDAEVMDAVGPQLKVVANFAVGYDNINVPAAVERGVYVCNTPGVLTEATADLAWTLLLGAARRAGEAERCLRAGQWEGWGPTQFLGVSVHGKTLGIYGMGRIGQAVARRARGFAMQTIYCSRTPLDPALEEALGARRVDKEVLFAESDFLSIHCPLTPETRHSVARRELQQMKPTAVLINTARGPIVKEEDLCAALREGLIFAAGLDVYEFEPAVCPELFREERALLLPHLGSATTETRATMARMAASNIVAALSGKTPPNCVVPLE